ncbi:MAG: hypothetical protein HYY06_24075 [Deltaproteobacteria bacterium]|nr:hypothetical protein [Deltaproteobacteria bacterium]
MRGLDTRGRATNPAAQRQRWTAYLAGALVLASWSCDGGDGRSGTPAWTPIPPPAAAVPAPVGATPPGPATTLERAPNDIPPGVAGRDPVAGTGRWPVPAWLCSGAVGTVSRNRGGSSITFKIRLAGGGRAAFKPDQLAGFSRFRAELAAYRLSELLAYGRVPPSCERSVQGAVLVAAAGDDVEFRERLGRELRQTGTGAVRGAAILWVDGIRPLDIRPADVPAHPLARELSEMIFFDELAGNWDRWSGGNVFQDATGKELVLIDNAAAFGPIGPERRSRMDAVLDRAAAPSERFVAALRALSRSAVATELEAVGYGQAQIDGVMERRDRIIARLDRRPASAGSGAGAAR